MNGKNLEEHRIEKEGCLVWRWIIHLLVSFWPILGRNLRLIWCSEVLLWFLFVVGRDDFPALLSCCGCDCVWYFSMHHWREVVHKFFVCPWKVHHNTFVVQLCAYLRSYSRGEEMAGVGQTLYNTEWSVLTIQVTVRCQVLECVVPVTKLHIFLIAYFCLISI